MPQAWIYISMNSYKNSQCLKQLRNCVGRYDNYHIQTR